MEVLTLMESEKKQIRPVMVVYVVCLLAALLGSLAGEETQPTGEAPAAGGYLENFLERAAHAHSFSRHADGGVSRWQREARPVLRELVGLDRIAQQTRGHRPQVELGAEQQRDGHTLQKGWSTSEPGVRLPFWWLRPMGDGPFPLAILPHGHDTLGQDTAAGIYRDAAHRKRTLAGDRNVAVQAVRQGFVAIAPAIRGLSDEANVAPDNRRRHGGKNCRSHLMHALLAGRTAMGE